MCLGVPGKIIETYQQQGLRMGRVDFGGTVLEACLAYVPEAEVGDYVVVHVGFAISRLSAEEAERTLRLLHEVDDLEADSSPPEVAP